jgi:hypothetical protein
MCRGPASRLYWTIIFIVALFLTILCLNTLIIDYLGYPVDTTVTYDNANIVSRLSYSFLYMSDPELVFVDL